MTPKTNLRARPRVSVLMTIYNAGPYLAEAIESLLAQDLRDWELVAIENGSTDGSHEVLESYRDDRIIVHRFESNMGRTAALQYAFEQASGELIAILDADDTAHALRLRTQVEFLEANPGVAVVASWAHYIDSTSAIIGTFTPPTSGAELLQSFGHSNPIAHSSAMYRKDAANEVGGYPADFKWAQDLALFIRLASKNAVAVLGEFLCCIRIQHSNMSTSPEYSSIVLDERMRLLEMAREYLPLSRFGRLLNRGATSAARLKIRWHRAEGPSSARHLAGVGEALAGSPQILVYVAMKWTRYRYTKLSRK